MKDIVCEKWGWVTGRVVSFYNIDVTKVSEFGGNISVRTIGAIAGAEQRSNSNSNMMTNNNPKALIKSIYINHNFSTSVHHSKMIT